MGTSHGCAECAGKSRCTHVMTNAYEVLCVKGNAHLVTPGFVQHPIAHSGRADDPLPLEGLADVLDASSSPVIATQGLGATCVAANGQVPVLHYHLGMAYLSTGNKAGAKTELSAALAEPKADFMGLADAREALATLN